MKIKLHKGDLPGTVDLGPLVAVDSETLGLNPVRDRLCLVQLSAGDGICHAIQFAPESYAAPNLKKMLVDPKVTKMFHFARFDVAMFQRYLGVTTAPIYCTKIASKLVRTYTDKHGLKDLVKELLSVDLSKEQQSSDWGAPELSEKQLAYAANDVAYLHRLKRCSMACWRANTARRWRRPVSTSCLPVPNWTSQGGTASTFSNTESRVVAIGGS